MRVVCIVGSPKPKGNTMVIVSAILRGLEAQGVQTTLVRLSDRNIGFCFGCKSCYQTGRCVQDDDVQQIVGDMLHADLVVVASPSYWGDVTGQMKVFIDRCTPYCNHNTMKLAASTTAVGAAVAIRAGIGKQENLNLVRTIEHFLGHLDIALLTSFTAERIDTQEDLSNNPQILKDAYAFGEELARSVPLIVRSTEM